MKDEINLLPPPAQDARLRRLYIRQAGRLMRLLIVLTLVLFLVLGASFAVLWVTEQEWIEAAPAGGVSSQEEAVREIKDINERLRVIEEQARTSVLWSPRVQDALEALPAGATLSEVGVDKSTGALVLRGIVQARDDVARYRAALRQLPWVKDVQAPLSNYATGSEEATFEFTIQEHGAL